MAYFRLARQVLLRLLLAFAALLAGVQLVRLLLVPAVQSVFGSGDAATSLVRRTGIVVFAVLAYWTYVRLVEKRAVVELRPAPVGIALGGLSGAALILLSMVVLFAGGVYEATAWRGLHSGLLSVAAFILIAALLEEIAYRCILFRILETGLGTLPALALQSLIFAVDHIANIEGQGSSQDVLTTVVAGALLGAMWTLVFVHTRNLWVTTANHAAWNFSIILAGLPLSGLEDWRALAPLASEYRGPGWLTGGLFGPEDSLLTIVLVAVAVTAMLYWAQHKQRLVRPGAALAEPFAAARPAPQP